MYHNYYFKMASNGIRKFLQQIMTVLAEEGGFDKCMAKVRRKVISYLKSPRENTSEYLH